jgi:hypothetical protein
MYILLTLFGNRLKSLNSFGTIYYVGLYVPTHIHLNTLFIRGNSYVFCKSKTQP